ncbi:MAG: RusA family crossover junction endodeoxyribonuclease [bacterium]
MVVKIDIDRIRYSLNNYIPAKITKNDLMHKNIFDKKLSIVIPGNPVSDSRPRGTKSGHFYNPNKNALKKLFKKLYEQDELLQKTCITYPHMVYLRIYVEPKKEFDTALPDELLKKENAPALGLKDNDNIEKVHWDILQDDAFKIILNDSSIVKNYTEKYYSNKPRIEIYVLYSENYIYDCYEKSIKKSMIYNKFKLSRKYIDMNNIKGDALFEHFKKHIKKLKFHIAYSHLKDKEKRKNKCTDKAASYINKVFYANEIETILKNINPQLLGNKKSKNVEALARYIVETKGKL